MTGSIEVVTPLGVKRAEISAIVTRADGTVEDLGVIASQDFGKKNVFKKLGEKLCRMF